MRIGGTHPAHRYDAARNAGLVGTAVLCILGLLISPAAALDETDWDDLLEQALEDSDLSPWEEYLGEDREQILNHMKNLLSGNLSVSDGIGELFAQTVREEMRTLGQWTLSLFALCLLADLCPYWVRDESMERQIGSAIGAACAALIAIRMHTLISLCRQSIGNCFSFLQGAQEVMAGLAAALGYPNLASLGSSAYCLYLAAFAGFVENFIVPSWMALVFLRLSALFIRDPLPDRLARGISRASQWGYGLGCGLAAVWMKAQMGFASAADSMTRRALRTGVEQGLPVIGGYLRDMVDTTMLSAGLLQKGLGSLSVAVVVIALAPICIRLIALCCALQLGSLGAGAAQLGERIREISGICLLCLGALVLCAFLGLFCLGQLANLSTSFLS